MLTARLKRYWYNASIRQKLMMFLVTMIFCISIFSLYMLITTYNYVNHFSGNVNKYFKVNVLQQNNTKSDRLLAKYLEDTRLDSLAEFNQSVDDFNATLQKIKDSSHSLEEYLLIRSIQNSFKSYCNETSLTIRKQIDGSKEYQIHYHNSSRINKYLDEYISQLLELSLSEGNTVYSHMVDDASVAMLIFSVIIMAFLLLCLVFGVALSNYLTRPIESLAKLSIQMSEGNLDVKQVKVPSRDEVGTLTESFNKMSSSIRKLVYDLQEKALVEKRLHREEVKNIKNRELLKEARFLALQSQINPHFLFNTLNTVSRVITFNRSEEAIKLINALSGILRYSMGSSKHYVTLKDELETVQKYIHIQQYRFGDRLKADIDCSSLEAGAVTIPCFTLQPIVENSVIHGLEPKVAGGSLRIRAYLDKGSVVIKIIDNGVGIPKEKLKSIVRMKNKDDMRGTRSIGLPNVMTRVATFGGKKGSFAIKSKVGVGTIVIIRLPIKR